MRRRGGAQQPRPRVGQVAGRRQRDVPDGRVELSTLDGRGRRERRAARDLLGARRAGAAPGPVTPGPVAPERPLLGALAVAEPQSPQRVGPQAADPARRRPAGRERAAPAVGAVDRRHHGRDPGALPERRQEPGAVLARDPARAAATLAAGVGERLGGGDDVGGEPVERRLPARDAVGELVAQGVEAQAGPGRGEQHGHAVQPVLAQEAREVGAAGVGVGRRERVGLVEDDDHRRRMPGQRPQLALVERGVGVLLRVDDPHEQVGERDDAVGLAAVRGLDGVEVGQVEEHEPGRAPAVPAVAAGHREPVEQRAGAVTPHRRGGGRRRRPADARRHEVRAGERVEERRLAGAGRAGQCHDGRLQPQPEPVAGPPHDRPRRRDVLGVQATVRERRGAPERLEPGLEGAHRARRTASAVRRTSAAAAALPATGSSSAA